MKVVYLLRNPGIASSTPAGWTHAVIAARPDGSYSEEAVVELGDADALVVGLEPVGHQVLARAPQLKLIQRLGVGYSNVDIDAAASRGVPVCNMPDFNAATVAEHTLMLILALLRRVFESTLLMKGGHWPVGTVVGKGIFDLQDKALGIVGVGAIGAEVARRARSFGVRLLYHDARGHAAELPDGEWSEFEPLLAQSDVVTLHLPLTGETRGLVGAAELARMRRTAVLVNTARGALVDETALAGALDRGDIAGAGLDVYSDEPLSRDHPLRRCPNVLLTPHIAGQTREAMERMVNRMVENLVRVERGEQPRGRCNA